MKNYEVRILKLEKDLDKYGDERNPCYAFTFPKSDMPNEKIVEILKKKFNLDVNLKQFTKWTRYLHPVDGGMTIFSPNFSIDKYILQHHKGII